MHIIGASTSKEIIKRIIQFSISKITLKRQTFFFPANPPYKLTSIISVCACLLQDVEGGVMVLISTKAFGSCPSSELISWWQAGKINTAY